MEEIKPNAGLSGTQFLSNVNLANDTDPDPVTDAPPPFKEDEDAGVVYVCPYCERTALPSEWQSYFCPHCGALSL